MLESVITMSAKLCAIFISSLDTKIIFYTINNYVAITNDYILKTIYKQLQLHVEMIVSHSKATYLFIR